MGDSVRFEVSDLNVEDRNITVNLNGFETKTSGIWIERTGTANAGYLQVSSTSEAEFEFKPPLGNKLTLAMPVRDVRFQLDDDFYADQEVATTSNVAFRTIKVDTSFSRHGSVPSVIQQADPIAKDFGWISTPWVYTNAIESSDTVTDLATTGVFMGGSTYTRKDEISLVSKGKWRFYADDSGELHGINTSDPAETLHVSGDTPTMLVSTRNYTEKATVALADFAEDYKSSGMYLAYDTVTGYGALELTPISPTTKFTISVGGYQKTPEATIEQSKVSIHTNLLVEQDATVDQSLFVNDTVYALSNLVGINNAAPTEALDVSGNIRGDSDLILNGLGPFAKIGTVTTLENFGRAGVIVEEETPIVQLSTTQDNYRHGSQLYFNDALHDQHWSIGTTNNGNTLDFGKSFGQSANTPEHGLDEYGGETLFRLNEEDRAEFILHANTSTPGMVINTRTNGVQLYLGEKPDVLSTARSTSAYTDNQFSSAVQWHGDGATVGEIGYFPNGNDDGEFGSFRFSRTDGTVNTSAPSAKVGVEQLYAHDRIGIKELSPTADLHVTSDTGNILMSTVDDNTLISLSVDNATKKAILRGEHKLPTNSYFQLSAQNPATLELGSDGKKLIQSADGSSGELQFEISETTTPSSYIIRTNTTETGHFINRKAMLSETKLLDTSVHSQSIAGDQKYKLELSSTGYTAITNLSAGAFYNIENFVDSANLKAYSKVATSDSSISLDIESSEVRLILENPQSKFEILNRPADGAIHTTFDGPHYTLRHSTQDVYEAYSDRFEFKVPVNFNAPAVFKDSLKTESNFISNGPTTFNDSITFSSGSTTRFDGSTTYSSTSDTTFEGPATFDDSVTYSSSSSTTFEGPATFEDNVTYSSSSNTTFNGPSTFNENLTVNETAQFDVKSSNTSFSNTVHFHSTTILGGTTTVGGSGISSQEDPNFKLAWKKEVANVGGSVAAITFKNFAAGEVFSVMGDVDIYVYDKDFNTSPFGVSFLNLKIAGYKISGGQLNMTVQETQTAIGDDYTSAYTKVSGDSIILYPAEKASSPGSSAGNYEYKVIFKGVIKNGEME